MTPAKKKSPLAHGDVFEFQVDGEKAYFQYTHDDPRFGFVIRVLPGTYFERPPDVCALAQQREAFYVCYELDVLYGAGDIVRLANCDIPFFARDFPLFRIERKSADGKSTTWILYDGQREQKLGRTLDVQKRRLPVYKWTNHASLCEMVRQRYRPENDYEPPAAARTGLFSRIRTARSEISGPERDARADVVVVRHYLVFDDEASAGRAAAEARRMGFDVEAHPDSDGGDNEEQWNVTLRRKHIGSTAVVSDEGSEMALLASKHGGIYDGNELESGVIEP